MGLRSQGRGLLLLLILVALIQRFSLPCIHGWLTDEHALLHLADMITATHAQL